MDLDPIIDTLSLAYDADGDLDRLHRRRRLLTRTARLIPALRDVENPMTRPSGGDCSEGHVRRAFAPTAARLDAVQLSDDIHMRLGELAAMLDVPSHGMDDARLAALLAVSPRLNRDGIQPALSLLETSVAKAGRVVSPPLPTIIVGECPNPGCRMLLRGTPDADTAHCRHCGNDWAVSYVASETRRRLLEDTTLMTTGEIAMMLTMTGTRISKKTIQAWNRKHIIQPVARHGNKPLYRVCDIYRIALDHARKETK